MNYLIAYCFLGAWTWGVFSLINLGQMVKLSALRIMFSLTLGVLFWPLFLLTIYITEFNKLNDLENK